MSVDHSPFASVDHDLGVTADGQMLGLVPMTAPAARVVALQMASLDPWRHYGHSVEAIEQRLVSIEPNKACFALMVGGQIAGAVVILKTWLAGPYLQTLAIFDCFQNVRAGSAVLAWYEASAQKMGSRNIWLCVTGINQGARRFYHRYGFEQTAILDDLLRENDREILMRKRIVKPASRSSR
jgi:ribosomal protein S18 acetylase RimI-like enzyme